ncbi:hypothetical protein ATCVTN60342_618L [Acanthocystis turfacea Chlorella virus TN603.4.2]|nr:hypothetical protein ATCVTN60342_618L [Acanthocystis turfacea Chlorella virus TN603.4.2]
MKYKTEYAENVLTAEQLCKSNGGYPSVKIENKQWLCHILAFKTFFPDEYATKKDDEMILHRGDNKLDFRPTMLYLGNRNQNMFDAYDNGGRNGTKTARKPVASFINGKLEQEYPSLQNATKYLRENGYPRATQSGIRAGIITGGIRYERTWKTVDM